jgi:hypothetical protein
MSKSCFYHGRNAQAEVSLHLRVWLINCTWVLSSALYEPSSSWLQVMKAQVLQRLQSFASRCCCKDHTYPFTKPNYHALPLYWFFGTVEQHCLKIVIWLILPVVICLSQRLSHACLSINVIQWNCEWLIKTVIVYLIIEFTWITVVILELIHAVKPDF